MSERDSNSLAKARERIRLEKLEGKKQGEWVDKNLEKEDNSMCTTNNAIPVAEMRIERVDKNLEKEDNSMCTINNAIPVAEMRSATIQIERVGNGFIVTLRRHRFVSMDWSMLSAALDRYWRDGTLEGFGIERESEKA